MGHCASKSKIVDSYQASRRDKQQKAEKKISSANNILVSVNQESTQEHDNLIHNNSNQVETPKSILSKQIESCHKHNKLDINKKPPKIPRQSKEKLEDKQSSRVQPSTNYFQGNTLQPYVHLYPLSKRGTNGRFRKLKKMPNIKILQKQQAEGPNGFIFECLNCDSGEICMLKIFDKAFNDQALQITQRSYEGSFIGENQRRNSENQINQSLESTPVTKQSNNTNDFFDNSPQSSFFRIQNLNYIDHKNIVRYLWVDHQNKQILMECLPGGSVKDLISKFGKFDEKIVQKYIKQAIRGVQELHEKYFVPHGNIKCSNILVDQAGVIKICDFFNDDPEFQKLTLEKKFQQDIFQIGRVTLEMLQGNCNTPFTNSDEFFDQLVISNECKDFISYCFNADTQKNLKDLLNHPFMTMEYTPSRSSSTDSMHLRTSFQQSILVSSY